MYRRLRDLRKDHDLPQKQVAKIFLFTNSAYAKIERGQNTLTADVLVTLSNFYDVSMTIYWDWQIFLIKFALENNFKEVLFEKNSKKAQKNHFPCYTVIENFLFWALELFPQSQRLFFLISLFGGEMILILNENQRAKQETSRRLLKALL